MNDLLTEALRTILQTALAALVPMLIALIVQQLRKVGLQVNAEHQAKLEHYAQLAALEAEEWASQRIKAHIGQVLPREKLERAIATLLDRVPGITRQEATAIIHAQLPLLGAGAAAALGEVRRAATNGVR